jgi:hypothetical protein
VIWLPTRNKKKDTGLKGQLRTETTSLPSKEGVMDCLKGVGLLSFRSDEIRGFYEEYSNRIAGQKMGIERLVDIWCDLIIESANAETRPSLINELNKLMIALVPSNMAKKAIEYYDEQKVGIAADFIPI